MNPTRNLLIFAIASCTLVGATLGCGDKAANGGGASCAAVCARSSAAKCENDPDCMSTCEGYKSSTPMGCSALYNALTRCLAGATFTCDADEQSEASACSSQESAYAKCVQSGGKDTGDQDSGLGEGSNDTDASTGTQEPDAGGNGNGNGTGNACGSNAATGDACGDCVQGACCTELLACQADTDCVTVNSCVSACNDDACQQACADASTQAGVDAYNALITCASDGCATECSDGAPGTADAGSGSGTGIGAPNDGDEGHASTTTPADCLPVPEDATGYCGEVKYKVIYDCPNAAPYSDCELNKIDARGIYCCGH